MREKRTIIIEKEITTYTCDCCGFSTEHNKGCCGVATIMTCSFCGNDCCHNCRTYYAEHDDDYGLYACEHCKEKANSAWEIAQEIVGRYDDIRDLHKKVFANLENYQ